MRGVSQLKNALNKVMTATLDARELVKIHALSLQIVDHVQLQACAVGVMVVVSLVMQLMQRFHYARHTPTKNAHAQYLILALVVRLKMAARGVLIRVVPASTKLPKLNAMQTWKIHALQMKFAAQLTAILVDMERTVIALGVLITIMVANPHHASLKSQRGVNVAKAALKDCLEARSLE